MKINSPPQGKEKEEEGGEKEIFAQGTETGSERRRRRRRRSRRKRKRKRKKQRKKLE